MLTPRTTSCMACSVVLILLSLSRLRKHWWHSRRNCLLTTKGTPISLGLTGSPAEDLPMHDCPTRRPPFHWDLHQLLDHRSHRRQPTGRRDCTLHVPSSNRWLHSTDVVRKPFGRQPVRVHSPHGSSSSSVHIEGYPARIHNLLLCRCNRAQIQRCALNRVNCANRCACFRMWY